MQEKIINEKITDEKLAYETQKGNKKALETLVRKYVPLIRKLVEKNFEKNYSQDLMQELWIKFIERTQNYKIEKNDNFAGYIKAMMYMDRWTLLRKHMNIIKHENGNKEKIKEIQKEDRYKELEKEELEINIKELKLTKKQEKLIRIKLENEDLTQEEIAQKLKISQVAISKMQKRIQEKVKEKNKRL